MITPARLRLTNAQLSVWIHQQIDPKATGYNIGQSIRFKGELNLDRLAFAQQAVIDRYDNLRCRFEVINNEPFQIIDENVKVNAKFWDLSAGIEAEVIAQKIIAQEIEHVFDLEKDRLARFGLVQVSDDEWIWFWVVHHIIADGWGGQLAMQYMADVYRSGKVSSQPASSTWPEVVKLEQSYRLSDIHNRSLDIHLQVTIDLRTTHI